MEAAKRTRAITPLSWLVERQRNWFRVVIPCQIVVIICLGVFTAFDQPFYARIDERAHVSYIEYVATHLRLPVLGRTCVQQNLVGLQPGYPGHRPGESCASDENAASYEAFQPPLFYVLAAPLWRLPLSIAGKIRVERLFCLFIVALAVAAAGVFVRREFGSARRRSSVLFSASS